MSDRGFKVRALGEIAIRCGDLGAMVGFYEDILGLERMTGNIRDGIVFFRIAPEPSVRAGVESTVVALLELLGRE